ncbi:MAG: D-aminoacyl-tRNA deacylase [Candidatus Methanoperedens sp.]|nr:D-aminoacyl-tRNA deacylase [Candidatus Methanoperedens sp.]
MTREVKVTVVCSTQDRASQNIKNNLLALRKWEHISSELYTVFEFKNYRLVEIQDPLIYQDGLDRKLQGSGFPASLIIFASKHRSKDARAILTVHSTGNIDEAKFGGLKKHLAASSPQAVRTLLRSLKLLSENEEYEVTLECTHHGPSEIDVPSVFIEIGSNEKQWIDEVAGRIVAEAILLYKENDSPVAVGFGGTHYAPRQTALILETDVAFGHIFPSHALDFLDEELIQQAFMRSKADFAYIDRKSMKAQQRERLSTIIEQAGYEVLKESDIRDMDGVPWQFCRQLRQKVKEVCPTGRARITDGIKCECHNCICPRVKIARISPALLSEAEKIDRERLEIFLSDHNIAYIEYEDGRFAHVLIGLDSNCARLAAEELTNECIEIIKNKYDVKTNNGVLQIIEKKFSTERAKALGLTEGPLFGRLARGDSVILDGKTINPEMVYEINIRAIKLNYEKAIEE